MAGTSEAEAPASTTMTAPSASTSRPANRGPVHSEVEAINLLDTAGAPVLKRLAPVAGGALFLVLLILLVRRLRSSCRVVGTLRGGGGPSVWGRVPLARGRVCTPRTVPARRARGDPREVPAGVREWRAPPSGQDGGMRSGSHNALTDVAGLRGRAHARRRVALRDDGRARPTRWCGRRGRRARRRPGHPGDRPARPAQPPSQRVHALVLSGGSAFGLAAADGVMARLARRGRGVPRCPGAAGADRACGGAVRPRSWRPGRRSRAAAHHRDRRGGRRCGGRRSGRPGCRRRGRRRRGGWAEGRCRDGERRARRRYDGGGAGRRQRRGGRPSTRGRAACWAPDSGCRGEFPPPPVDDGGRAALRAPRSDLRLSPLGTATTLAVVATDATLDKAGCARLAAMGHDGLARALSPVHTALDGDVVFGLATGAAPAPTSRGSWRCRPPRRTS